ncbi:MAG TPA: hypothetical protein VD763_12445 [Candidatus Saccharimonadales bacterium]|nr:hypothetical protein [Candidatus Saccharimonadales bacterium]
MYPIQFERMTHDHQAELRRQAERHRLTRSVMTETVSSTPEPRIPRRGPLAAVARLRLALHLGEATVS